MSSIGEARVSAVVRALESHFDRGPLKARWHSIDRSDLHAMALFEVGGRTYFCKWSEAPLNGAFASEAHGLRALRERSTCLKIPDVIAYDDEDPKSNFLLLENLSKRPQPRTPAFEENLARGLAQIHLAPASPHAPAAKSFGFDIPGYCGRTPQPNSWKRSWVEFYREIRLTFQLDLAIRNGLSSTSQTAIRQVIDDLDQWLHEPDKASLIHGDLWSGNILCVGDGQPALIDPAAYYADREAEFGMTALFGGLSSRFYEAYHEAYPLEEGWRERLPLYTLYHVLNHFNLFGGSYDQQAGQMATQIHQGIR